MSHMQGFKWQRVVKHFFLRLVSEDREEMAGERPQLFCVSGIEGGSFHSPVLRQPVLKALGHTHTGSPPPVMSGKDTSTISSQHKRRKPQIRSLAAQHSLVWTKISNMTMLTHDGSCCNCRLPLPATTNRRDIKIVALKCLELLGTACLLEAANLHKLQRF